jgi:hypothetical protein
VLLSVAIVLNSHAGYATLFDRYTRDLNIVANAKSEKVMIYLNHFVQSKLNFALNKAPNSID